MIEKTELTIPNTIAMATHRIVNTQRPKAIKLGFLDNSCFTDFKTKVLINLLSKQLSKYYIKFCQFFHHFFVEKSDNFENNSNFCQTICLNAFLD